MNCTSYLLHILLIIFVSWRRRFKRTLLNILISYLLRLLLMYLFLVLICTIIWTTLFPLCFWSLNTRGNYSYQLWSVRTLALISPKNTLLSLKVTIHIHPIFKCLIDLCILYLLILILSRHRSRGCTFSISISDF